MNRWRSGQMSETNVESGATAETKHDSAVSMLWNVLLEPTRVFKRIREKPTWALPFIIFLLAFVVVTYLVTPLALEAKKQEISTSEKLSQEQRDAQLQQLELGKKFAIVGAIVAPIGAGILYLVIWGALILTGTVIQGGTAKASAVWSVLCYSLVPGIISTIVRTPLMLSKGSMDIRTSLAVLLPASAMNKPGFSVLNTFTDIFVVWEIVLLIIGVSVIYGFTKQKASITILVPAAVIAVIMGVVSVVTS